MTNKDIIQGINKLLDWQIKQCYEQLSKGYEVFTIENCIEVHERYKYLLNNSEELIKTLKHNNIEW